MLALALLPAVFAATDPCKGVKVEEDQFTHERTAMVYGWAVAPLNLVYEMHFAKDRAWLRLDVPASGQQREALRAGHKVLLLMEDQSIIDLTTDVDVPPTVKAGYSVFTIWHLDIAVDKPLAQRLAAQPIVSIRTTVPDGEFTWKVTKGKKSASTFACFAHLLP